MIKDAVGFQKGEARGIIAINPDLCKGCDGCKRRCPNDAVNGSFGAVHSIDTERCLGCGQCLVHCPFGAPYEVVDAVDDVIAKLDDPEIVVAGIIAPAVRVAIGEEFGFATGELVTGQLYGAMHAAGFRIFDNNYTADLTIMEEGSELIERIRSILTGAEGEHAKPLPQFTSCCPAWVRFVELNYPSLLANLSSAKSPMQMAGPVAKTYGAAQIWKVPPQKVYTVGIMPCTAKVFEATRPEFNSAWRYAVENGEASATEPYPDVDAVLTTRDLARLFRKKGIDLRKVPGAAGDSKLAEYSGAGTIFGNTGGVMEAALRTAYAVMTGTELEKLEFEVVRGFKGVKSASIPIHDKELDKEIVLNVAVVHGIRENIAPVLDEVLAGRSPYHFIEVMNCPGGCVNGGGQPIHPHGSGWLGNSRPIFAWK